MGNNTTLKNIKPDDMRLGAIMRGADIKPKHPKRIQDYLRENHERNELKRDIAQIKRHVDTVHLWLRIGMAMLVLVFAMQMLLWIAG